MTEAFNPTEASRAPRRGLASAATLLALALAGCGGDGGSAPEASVQDSAGVRIITNSGAGSWSDAERWQLEEELSIGVASGDPEFQFGMLAGVDADAEGNIVTLDQQAQRIRVFDDEGNLLHAFGRAGGGPGELSQALSLATGVFFEADGTIAVPDMGNARLARFTREGEPLESPRLDMSGGIPMLFKRAGDRTMVLQRRQMAMPGMTDAPASPTDHIVKLSPGAMEGEILHSLPSGETFTMGSDGMPRFRIFSPEPVWEVLSDGRIVTGTNNEYSLALRDGDEVTIVRRAVTQRPVTERHEAEMLGLMRESMEQSGQPIPAEVLNQILSGVEFAESWPALSALLAGPEGTLWVQRVDPDASFDDLTAEDLQSGRIGSPNWDVFDREGAYLGVVTMPGGVVPLRFVGDHLYGIHHDDMDIQRVVRLALQRGA